jgi:methylmalonyl-CoA/ethylmalonyl-CoA epimerase
VEENGVRKLALYYIGESMVELIAGKEPDGKHQRMVAEGKGGLNHICFEVEDIDEALAELKAKGIPLLDQVPRIGHAGCRIAFVDRSATENCLIELAQLPAEPVHHP